jgi:hypothetical protein
MSTEGGSAEQISGGEVIAPTAGMPAVGAIGVSPPEVCGAESAAGSDVRLNMAEPQRDAAPQFGIVDVSNSDPGPMHELDADEYTAHVEFQEKLVKPGFKVVKYSLKKGKREVRRLKLSKNRSEIMWQKDSLGGSSTKLSVREVSGVRFGITTVVLRDRIPEHKRWDPEHRCFSLICGSRCFDFACMDEADTTACVLALQSAIRGARGYTRGVLAGHIQQMQAVDTMGIKSLKVIPPSAPPPPRMTKKPSDAFARADADHPDIY